jgi:hypothetical protein
MVSQATQSDKRCTAQSAHYIIAIIEFVGMSIPTRPSTLMINQRPRVQQILQQTASIQLRLRPLHAIRAFVRVDTQLAQERPHDTLRKILRRHCLDVFVVVTHVGTERCPCVSERSTLNC